MKSLKLQMLILVAIVLMVAGCSGTIIPGLRFAPDETQKQAADGADNLAGRLAVTGARPGSAAAVALARMTRPAAVFAGPPKTPLDLEDLANIEIDQWRHKDDQVRAALLRDDLRKRAMQITTTRLGELGKVLDDQKAPLLAVLDRFAAVATVAEMADDLADVIPDPRSPDDTRSPEEAKRAAETAEALKELSAAANKIAASRVDAGTMIDKTLDAVETTAAKAVETKNRLLGLAEDYAPEIAGVLGLFGIGGYAIKKRAGEKKAKAEIEAVKKTA